MYAVITGVKASLNIIGQVSAPDVGLQAAVPVRITYLLDGSGPAQWEITVPDGVDLSEYTILFPLCLPPLQFIILDSSSFNGTFQSIATVTRNNTFFILNITGGGLVNDGNSITVTFDAIAYGDFNLTSYTYDLSAIIASYTVEEDIAGVIMLSTFIEADLFLDVTFEYNPEDVGQRPFDNQLFKINQSAVSIFNNKLVFDATGSLECDEGYVRDAVTGICESKLLSIA